MRYIFSLLLCLILTSFALAQENPSPYELALQLIEEAQASGVGYLYLGNLGLTELPPEIGNLSNLQTLELFTNQLSSLPPEIGNLSNLQVLHLSYNQLTTLPAEIGKLSNLRVLGLYNNSLSNLPIEIGNLSKLQELYLGSNQLSTLPAEIGNLSSLCYLDITANSFERFPVELYPLKNLGRMGVCSYVPPDLMIDSYLLDGFPDEVRAGGAGTILAYLENEAWWHLQRLIAGGAGAIGLLGAIILGWRWKNRRGKSKRKNSDEGKR